MNCIGYDMHAGHRSGNTSSDDKANVLEAVRGRIALDDVGVSDEQGALLDLAVAGGQYVDQERLRHHTRSDFSLRGIP